MLWVDKNTIDWTHHNTLFLLIMPDALRATASFNFINEFALINSIIRAFRLANIAINALISNIKRD